MTEKFVGIYGTPTGQTPFNSDQLIVDISPWHIVAYLKLADNSKIGAFEIFTFDTEQDNWYDIFYETRSQSKILDRGYINTSVFFNFPQFVLVPESIFNVAGSSDYVNSVHGDRWDDLVKDDKIKLNPSVINIYKINKQLNDMVNGNMMMVNPRHTASILTEKVCQQNKQFATNYFKIVFYQHHFLVAVTSFSKLLIVQSFFYTSSEDVMYYLLSIVKQFGLKISSTLIELSGWVDKKSVIFENINKVFPSILFDEIGTASKFHNDLMKFPPYYFSPYFNLLS